MKHAFYISIYGAMTDAFALKSPFNEVLENWANIATNKLSYKKCWHKWSKRTFKYSDSPYHVRW